jgi:carbamoyl-phosphate synthase small subunit
MTPQRFAERGVRVHVVPADTTLEEIQSYNPDGFFMSNGPGDPATADAQVDLLRSVLKNKTPFFGICFGNQILGRALGFGTYKLPFGHRGINQPVLDKLTGKVEITAQNHGFAVDAPVEGKTTAPIAEFGEIEVSHVGLNDQVVEGIRCLDIPAFSVQYHPEAAAGPHDSAYLFDRFIDLMLENKN